jgi:hypothetical protein
MGIKEHINFVSEELLKLACRMKAINDPEYRDNGELMRVMVTRMRYWTEKLKDVDAEY